MVRFGGTLHVKSVRPIISNQYNMAEEEQEEQKASYFMVRHNDKIVGFYNTEAEADDSKNGYQMENNVGIDDKLDVLKIL